MFSKNPVMNERTRAYAAVVFACLLWGSSFFFGKLALREMAAEHVVLWRFLIASLLFVPVLLRKRFVFEKRHIGLLVLAGVLMVPVTFIVQFQGLALTSATNAILIVSAYPPLQALGSRIFHKEKTGKIGWVAIALSTMGVVVMVGIAGGAGSRLGDLLVFISTVASVAWVLVTRQLLQQYPSLIVTAYSVLIGTAALVPVTLGLRGLPNAMPSPATWLALAGLGLLCTVATYSLWNWGLRLVPTSHAGVLVNLEPVVGVLLGVTLLHESLSTGALVGGLLILGSALLLALEHPRAAGVAYRLNRLNPMRARKAA